MKNLRLKYGNIELEIQDNFEIDKSSNEVVYSDITCNWNQPMSNLPQKLQEVQIINKDNDQVESYGYINSYTFGQMRETDVETDIEFNLLSPMKLTTLRTIIAKGTYQLVDLMQNTILAPLIYDGFTIKKIEIPDHQVTINYNLETIEFCMNNLSSKFNFWWYIDEHKYIYIIDIDILVKQEPRFKYDDENMIEGLMYIKPTTNSDDYANVVNFKNVRTYQRSVFDYTDGQITEYKLPLIKERVTSLKAGEEVVFQYPVDIKKENIEKSALSLGYSQIIGRAGLYMNIKYTDNTYTTARIWINYSGTYEISSNIGFDDDNQQKEFTMVRDPFFSNLITGFIYNGTKTIAEINRISSDSALIWNVNKFYNDEGIQAMKGKLSNTGIVETTIDMNESWKTIQEITEIAKTYLNKVSLKYADEIEMRLDNDTLKIGDVIYINKFGIDSNYVVIDISEIAGNNDIEYVATCKNANLIQNYLDVFRKETTQEEEERTYEVYVTHYSNEGIEQNVEVEL